MIMINGSRFWKMGNGLPMFVRELRKTIMTSRLLKKWILCIVPVALLLAIPITVALFRDSKTPDGTPSHSVAGVDEKRFYIWIEATWLGLWACEGLIHLYGALKKLFRSQKETKNPVSVGLMDRLTFPLALSAWSVFDQLIFAVCIRVDKGWVQTTRTCLKAIMLCSLIYLAKELLIQKIRIISEGWIRKRQEKPSKGLGLLLKLQRSPNSHFHRDRILAAFETDRKTLDLARSIFDEMTECYKEYLYVILEPDLHLWGDYGLAITHGMKIEDFADAVLKIRAELRETTDLIKVINDLSDLCWLVTFTLWAVIAVIFLAPNLSQVVATSVIALLLFSFALATTCQEVAGSCMFLFVKHPYDVNDRVKIGESELVVEHITLLYTDFVRVGTGLRTQYSNHVLNGLWIDNQNRSNIVKKEFGATAAADTKAKETNFF